MMEDRLLLRHLGDPVPRMCHPPAAVGIAEAPIHPGAVVPQLATPLEARAPAVRIAAGIAVQMPRALTPATAGATLAAAHPHTHLDLAAGVPAILQVGALVATHLAVGAAVAHRPVAGHHFPVAAAHPDLVVAVVAVADHPVAQALHAPEVGDVNFQ